MSGLAKKKVKIWYRAVGGSQEESTAFYDRTDFCWAASLEANWESIRDEIENFMSNRSDSIRPYFNRRLASAPQKWKTIGFKFWNRDFKENQEACPETMKVMADIPHVTTISVSILEPGVEIYVHNGDTNAAYRCHLPLSVPAPLPYCGFRVGGETRSWKEGELLIFNDAALHEAWNRTDQPRYVLLFDVFRPEFIHKKHRVCAFVLATMTMQALKQKYVLIQNAPTIVKANMQRAIAVWAWVSLRLQNGGVA